MLRVVEDSQLFIMGVHMKFVGLLATLLLLLVASPLNTNELFALSELFESLELDRQNDCKGLGSCVVTKLNKEAFALSQEKKSSEP